MVIALSSLYSDPMDYAHISEHVCFSPSYIHFTFHRSRKTECYFFVSFNGALDPPSPNTNTQLVPLCDNRNGDSCKLGRRGESNYGDMYNSAEIKTY